VNRVEWLAFCGLLCAVNALAPKLIGSVQLVGFLPAALGLFGVSAVVWLALAAVVTVAREERQAAPLSRTDSIIGLLAILAAGLPLPQIGGIALFLVGLWLTVTSQATKTGRRVGLLLIGLSGTLFWGQVAFLLFGDHLLAADGLFVSQLSGTAAQQNLVRFSDGQQFLIGPACSSLHNITIATLIWVTLTQLFKVKIDRRLIAFGLMGVIGVIFVNGIRLAVIANFHQDFDWLHHGAGAELFAWASLTVASVCAAIGVFDASRRQV
jgi:exosortase/archaeosortase family protein